MTFCSDDLSISTFLQRWFAFSQNLKNLDCNNKILVQVEGATCSGKSSFVKEISSILKSKGINLVILEEAANKIFNIEQSNHKLLYTLDQTTDRWKSIKKGFQRKVLVEQLDLLENFFLNDENIAIMDRGGASTAWHTLPLFIDQNLSELEIMFYEISKLSNMIILLSPLGFLENSRFRYQKNYDEVLNEAVGIKAFLDMWQLEYSEIKSTDYNERINIGVSYIMSLISKQNY